MRMKLRFTKMQGAGNDYIYLDCRERGLPADPGALARRLSRRRFSVGADGVICIGPPLLADADATMYIFNADGSEGTMCGNGARCVAEYLYTRDPGKTLVELDTPGAGRKTLYRVGEHLWRAGMGRFSTRAQDLPAVGLGTDPLLEVPLVAAGRPWQVSCISMGNPHCVVYCRSAPPAGANLATWGAALERHPAFPQRTNVEFVRMYSKNMLEVTVWERGSGATLACGTGACAAAVAMMLQGRCPRKEEIRVRLPGGQLSVRILADDTVLLTGPARTVFDGEIEL